MTNNDELVTRYNSSQTCPQTR